MQNLINSLNRGISEVNDVGENITRPPTATMLRAARIIADLANQAQSNQQIMMQQQARIEQQLQELANLTKELENARISSVCNGGREAGKLESGGEDNSTSDSSSAERAPTENSSSDPNQVKEVENAKNSFSTDASVSTDVL